MATATGKRAGRPVMVVLRRRVRLSGNGGRAACVLSFLFSSRAGLWDQGPGELRALTRRNPGRAPRSLVSAAPGSRAAIPARALRPWPSLRLCASGARRHCAPSLPLSCVCSSGPSSSAPSPLPAPEERKSGPGS